MINELIKFCNEINSDTAVSVVSEKEKMAVSRAKSVKSLKPIIIIHPKEDKDRVIQFAKCELLKTDEEIVRLIDEIPDMQFQKEASYFRKWISKQNNLRENNKRLGTTHGLLNSVPYVAVLTEKNVSKFEEKAAKMSSPKTGWKTQMTWTDKKLQDKLTDSLRQVYHDFWKSKPKEDLTGIPIFVLFPKKINGIDRKDIYLAFENDRKNEWENEDNVSKDEMNCPLCGQNARLGALRNAT